MCDSVWPRRELPVVIRFSARIIGFSAIRTFATVTSSDSASLSSLTNVQYSATQYALLSSMMLLLPKFVAGFSGKYVDAFGYANFFSATALLGVPVLLLVALASRVRPAA